MQETQFMVKPAEVVTLLGAERSRAFEFLRCASASTGPSPAEYIHHTSRFHFKRYTNIL